jgi:hypothetical protein
MVYDAKRAVLAGLFLLYHGVNGRNDNRPRQTIIRRYKTIFHISSAIEYDVCVERRVEEVIQTQVLPGT